MLRDKWLLWGQKLIEKDPWFLAPLGWLWGFVAFCKNTLYNYQLLPTHRVPCTVVSIGNLVAGGTGKTPFVHLLASHFPNRKIAILSRGYGSNVKQLYMKSEVRMQNAEVKRVPDEAMVLKRRAPHASIYVGKDRLALARQAARDGAELILLDDGFQYRKLARNFDLVLLSNHDPFGRGHYLPRGFLRDSPKRLKQADAVFITGDDLIVTPGRILDLKEREIPSIQGMKVGLFCGIAKPTLFRKTVTDLGATVAAEFFYADHGVPEGIHPFSKKCKSLGASALICTEKDFVKISPSLQTDLPIYFLEISLTISKQKEQWEKLIAKIDQTIDNFSSYA